MNSATKAGFTRAQLVEEQTKILQISADIKSIERELSVLSEAKTEAWHSAKLGYESNSIQGDVSDQFQKIDCEFSEPSKHLMGVRKNLLNSYFEDDTVSHGLERKSQDPVHVNCRLDTNLKGAKPIRQVKSAANCETNPAGSGMDCCAEDTGVLSPKIARVGEDTLLNHALGAIDGEDVDLAR